MYTRDLPFKSNLIKKQAFRVLPVALHFNLEKYSAKKCSLMPTQTTTGFQEDVSPITVIPELVLGFLSLTIEVDSFDPEKGW